ncbi:cysteine desulfurase / selenocysteine lyase [Eubacterium ruminantium]|nr:cysteine desulfurase / selenocysteine lyase [Eubacterium ruminantium]
MSIDIKEIRKDFPFFKRNTLAYLDNSATSQKPEAVIKAEAAFYETLNANPFRGLYQLSIDATDAYEDARRTVQRFINAASRKEIIFTRNASESLNLVAACLGELVLNEGDEIITTIVEHHSNMLPWTHIAAKKGAKVKFLECTKQGEFRTEDFKALLTDRTKIVAMTHMSNVFGRINDIKTFAELAHSVGAYFVADGSQSVPHIPVDVQELGVDFLAFSGHKMLAPMGIGVLYGKKDILLNMPPYMTGGEMIENVSVDSVTYAGLPHKFEAGTVNGAGAYALAEAVRYYEKIGFSEIEKREHYLTAKALEGIKKLPYVELVGSDDPKERNGIITFTVKDMHPHDIAGRFADAGVAVRAGHHCAEPLHQFLDIPSTVRASIMFYNTDEDIDRFLGVLKNIKETPKYENADRSLFEEVLMDHKISPAHSFKMISPTNKHRGVNPSCGDDIFLQLKVDENGVITDGSFTGNGCTISQASVDIMLDMVIGMKKEEALLLKDKFLNMIKGTASDEEIDSLEEASVFKDVSHMPARVKCAVLGWHTLEEALKED